nr:unnamed protein product [Callosobruchus chinensis]
MKKKYSIIVFPVPDEYQRMLLAYLLGVSEYFQDRLS